MDGIGLAFGAIGGAGTGPDLVTRGHTGSRRWFRGFAGGVYEPGDATVSRYSGGMAGFVSGTEGGGAPNRFVAVSMSAVNGAGGTSFRNESVAVLAGGYGTLPSGAEYIVAAGYQHSWASRTIASVVAPGGFETASGSYGTLAFVPQISRRFTVNGLPVKAGLTYGAIYAMGYSERGSSANATYGVSLSHHLQARATVTRPLREGLDLRIGAEGRYSSNPAPQVSVAGTALTGTSASNRWSVAGVIGVDYASANAPTRFSAELSATARGRVTGTLSLRMQF